MISGQKNSMERCRASSAAVAVGTGLPDGAAGAAAAAVEVVASEVGAAPESRLAIAGRGSGGAGEARVITAVLLPAARSVAAAAVLIVLCQLYAGAAARGVRLTARIDARCALADLARGADYAAAAAIIGIAQVIDAAGAARVKSGLACTAAVLSQVLMLAAADEGKKQSESEAKRCLHRSLLNRRATLPLL